MEVKTSSGLVADANVLLGAAMRHIRRNAQTVGFHPMTYTLQQAVKVKVPGIYKNVDDFGSLLSGDRMQLYHKIREATKGKLFDFKLPCPVKGCNKPISWTVDLQKLPIKELPEEHKKILANKNEFTEQLEGYGEVKVKYTDGHDEMRLLDNMGKYDEFTAMVLGQIISVGDKKGEAAILKLMDENSADLTDKLLIICRKYEFGPVTAIQVVCHNPRCETISTVQMPSDIRFFYDAIGQLS